MKNLLKKTVVTCLLFSGISTANAQNHHVEQIDIDRIIDNLIATTQVYSDQLGQNATNSHDVFYSNQAYHAIHNQQGTVSQNPFAITQKDSVVSKLLKPTDAPYKAANHIARNAKSTKSLQKCALYVRLALQAAGYNVTPQASAYMYNNGEMAKIGFKKIPQNNYQPQVGDVVVFNRTAKNPHGHIQIYTGKQWVSDFKQPSMMVYGNNHNGYTIWRDVNFIDASMKSNRAYLAMNK